MPSERDATVMRAYPDLFGPEPWDMRHTAMTWGFMVDEGWRPIVLELLDELRVLVAEEGLEAFRIVQVKEKWGSLRVYATVHTERIDAAIDRAQARADRTCEACGAAGELRTDRPCVQVLCDAHAAARGRWETTPHGDEEE